MKNCITVVTFNELETKDGGYHEIHDIKYLSSPEHALTTVKNIIDSNIKYGDKDCLLTGIEVNCTLRDTYILIKEFYEKYSDDLKVWVQLVP
ncbi:MAG: hypothetical protein PHT02_01130 [Tissierellia bacterium]|nr:hypothetical protein [Tissierellia bacterium]